MIIDCQSCVLRDVACADCVVTHFLAMPVEQQIPATEARALAVLGDAGLVPPLRMETEQIGRIRRARLG